MRILRQIFPLLIAAALLLSANGLQSTVLALRGLSEGFDDIVIGLLLSSYFAGFILGCRYAPEFIASVGHIRAFTAFASIASASALAHAVAVDEWVWLVLRAGTGFCFAALQMILESWLNEVADNKSRGKVLSIYRITDFTGVTLAQLAVGLFDPDQFIVFAVLSIALSVALVPVALTPVTPPPPPSSARLDLGRLWRVSPMAAAGAFAVGMSASAFWSMGPVFVTRLGYDATTVGLFVAAIIFGGAVAQWPVGALSDRFDRRRVLLVCAMGASVMAVLLPGFGAQSETGLILAAIGFGVFALPNFGLAIAHASDHAEPGTAVSVTGGLLMLYGVAAIGGPLAASSVMNFIGTPALFYWVAVVYAGLVAFGLYRLTRRASPRDQAPYVPVPRTSPAVFELDPRGEPDEDEPAEGAETPIGAPSSVRP